MTVMFYCITKDRKLLNKLPDTFSEIEEPTLQQTLIEETQSDFERIQAKYDASLFTFVCPVKSPVQNAQKEIA